jgi:ABC-type multidrug transport system permease subunit
MNLNWAVVAGVLINSAIYFLTVFVAGIWMGNILAVKVCIAAVGITYLSYLAQALDAPPPITIGLVALSIIAGAGAGLLLL